MRPRKKSRQNFVICTSFDFKKLLDSIIYNPERFKKIGPKRSATEFPKNFPMYDSARETP